MKVLVLNDFVAFPGGGTSMAHFSAEVLAARGHEVHFVAGQGSPNERPGATYRVETLGLSDVREQGKLTAAGNGVYRFAAAAGLKRLLKRFPPEETSIVLHQWTRVLSPAVFQAIRRYRVVVYAHDYFLACPTGSLYRFDTERPCTLRPMSVACIACACDRESRLHKGVRIVRLALQNALVRRVRRLGVLFVSEGQAKRYGRLFPPAARHVLPNISTNPPTEVDAGAPGLRSQALYVGRIVPEKGPQDLAEAARRTGVQCTFAGDGPVLTALRDAYPEHRWLGWRSRTEIAALMRNAEVLVLPSRWPETAALVVSEALQQGAAALISSAVCTADDLAAIPRVTVYDPFRTDALEFGLKHHGTRSPASAIPPAADFARAALDYAVKLEAILSGS